MREIVVDNFAGGGGASTGIEIAMGRSVDIAINHDPAAIAMHRANHPTTEHYTEDVWKVDPVEACAGRPVALAWFSPDCKHHSKAKGGKPVSKHIRGLAWVAVRWAKKVHPRVIMLEKLFYCGTFSLLISAVIAHALFNTLIQSQYKLAAYGVIAAMYVPQLMTIIKSFLSRKQA